jgi:hypothetical protein
MSEMLQMDWIPLLLLPFCFAADIESLSNLDRGCSITSQVEEMTVR